jgi:uncharacterized RDD family membrane protein YckC
MSGIDDRYQVSEASMANAAEEPISVEPVGRGRRFANYLIDIISQLLLVFVLSTCAVLVWGEQWLAWLEKMPDIVLGIAMTLLYYLPTEGLSGRTVGKLITGTVVVDGEGRRPTFKQVAGRTFARLIPFEIFSIFGQDMRAWHDSMPDTYVVMKR